MSTKIYNGYALPKMSTQELNDFCDDMKKSLSLFKEKEQLSTFFRLAVREIDANKDEGTESLFDKTKQKMQEEIKEIVETNSRNPSYDFASNVLFIPMEDKTLALLYADNRKMVEIWQSNPLVRDYHYQDQTDSPEEINEDEWKKRDQDWESILSPYQWIPSNIPKKMEFKFTDIESIEDHLLNKIKDSKDLWAFLEMDKEKYFSFRKQEVLNELLWQMYCKENPINKDNVWRAYKNFLDWKDEESTSKTKEDLMKTIELKDFNTWDELVRDC